MYKVTLVDRNEFSSEIWANIIRLGYVERVKEVKNPNDLLIPIMDTEDPLVLDVTNLRNVVCEMRDSAMWRLVERAMLSRSGGIITTNFYDSGCVPAIIDTDNPKMIHLLDKMRPLPNSGPGVGNWNPSNVILIVGERPGNEPSVMKNDHAFLSDKGSSAWLCRQLDNCGYPESHMYWINAFDRQNRMTDGDFLEELNPTSVYALGNYASDWCSQHMPRIQYESFTHPQYWKRFRSSEMYPLIETIEQKDYCRLDFPRSVVVPMFL